jgi:4-amino-4-deoxy-L-arabinose transferase-like glycosyltransferase
MKPPPLTFLASYQNVSSEKKLLHVSFALFTYIALLVLAFARLTNDSVVYALLAKHMVLHKDWFSLVYQGTDWLDKPHFPFWMVAISF